MKENPAEPCDTANACEVVNGHRQPFRPRRGAFLGAADMAEVVRRYYSRRGLIDILKRGVRNDGRHRP